MKRMMELILLGVALTLPFQVRAWVAYGRPGYGCWHGGWSCGGVSTGTAVAAGLTGLAVGAAIGAAAARPPVVVAPAPVVIAPAPVVVAPAPVVVAPVVPIGSIYPTLPYGAQAATINGTQYYVANGVYYRPYFGGNGVYYEVVANPI